MSSRSRSAANCEARRSWPWSLCDRREPRALHLVLCRAQQKLSFGRMTLPHPLMRLVLTEQIYRTVKINRGEPYHK
ncbi:23S rRNA (pseudouridine(1915)-N(3))-methyltransferase RlmH [Paenibacillus thiaminolyticus]|uniref:23S rRNA (pseudouridine(1915)-N(3))-methyltransferase RlmH n=1 Tax=Paenibacillus thiaminolyticus TaxID=49283 RepID=UPI003D6CE16D